MEGVPPDQEDNPEGCEKEAGEGDRCQGADLCQKLGCQGGSYDQEGYLAALPLSVGH